jgi:MFS family permease
LISIDGRLIDYARARGATERGPQVNVEGLRLLLRDRVMLSFLAAAFLFHLANAAMLPQLGEMLSRNNPRMAAPFMSACIIVTQCVIAASATWIGRRASAKGRRRLLLVGYGVLPVRGVLYTLTNAAGALIAIQTLDGIANAVFVIVSILIIKDRTDGTGRFNLAAGALGATVGIGAALSNTLGGVLIKYFSYRASFLGLAAIASLAFAVLFFSVPETLRENVSDLREMAPSAA